MTYIWDYQDKNAYNNRSGHYKTQTQFKFIVDNCRDKTSKILDIAGGAGRFAIPLLDYSKNITVLDINQTAIQILKTRNSALSTICGDFSKTDFHEKFSLILCIEALGYFKDWKEFFNKINSLMDDEGRLIFSYTNPNSWRFLLRNLKRLVKGTKSYTEMKFTDLNDLLNSCGLQIEKMDGMNWMPLPIRSNSMLVPFFEFMERRLKLNNWHAQSPWLMISVKKYK